MKPVDQTILNGDGSNGRPPGDCFRACVASILEVPIDQVPHFVAESADWWVGLNEWLQPRGLFYLDTCLPETEQRERYRCRFGYHIITDRSPRGGVDHSVVGLAGEVVHDPHPDRAGVQITSRTAYGFLISFSPHGGT